MLIFSDIHLKEETAETVLGLVLPGIYQAAKEHGETEIVCLGDVFHVRYRVPVKLLVALRDELCRWEGVSLFILPGNHDQINVEGRNVLEHLDDLKHVSVYSEPVINNGGFWVPYRKRPEDLAAALRKAEVARNVGAKAPPVAWMHQGIQGAWMNDNFRDIEGIPSGWFRNFRWVFCGHYHKHQTIGRTIWYVGSPYQTRADEAGQPKGYTLWNPGQAPRFVETFWGPRYHKLKLEKGDPVDVTGIRPGDIVRVETAVGVIPEHISQALKSQGIHDHVITPEVQPLEARLEVGPGASLESYVLAYVDKVPTELDRKRLLAIFQGLVVGEREVAVFVGDERVERVDCVDFVLNEKPMVWQPKGAD